MPLYILKEILSNLLSGRTGHSALDSSHKSVKFHSHCGCVSLRYRTSGRQQPQLLPKSNRQGRQECLLWLELMHVDMHTCTWHATASFFPLQHRKRGNPKVKCDIITSSHHYQTSEVLSSALVDVIFCDAAGKELEFCGFSPTIWPLWTIH